MSAPNFKLSFEREKESDAFMKIVHQGKWIASYFDNYKDPRNGQIRTPWIVLTKDCPQHIKELLKATASQFND